MKIRIAKALLSCLMVIVGDRALHAVELFEITPETRPNIGGKEVDWVDGDIVLRNDQLICIIAAPIGGRDANMTVRGVGGGIIDLTRLEDDNDQLSAFYPTAQQFKFIDPTTVTSAVQGDTAYWQCQSIPNRDGAVATLRYELSDEDNAIACTVDIDQGTSEVKSSNSKSAVRSTCAVRADRTFKFDVLSFGDKSMGVFYDTFFQQSYGIELAEAFEPSWSKDRAKALAPLGDSAGWTVRLYPASALVELAALCQPSSVAQEIRVDGVVGDHARVQLMLEPSVKSELPDVVLAQPIFLQSDSDAASALHLPPGEYEARLDAIGHESVTQMWQVTEGDQFVRRISFDAATAVDVRITDETGDPTAAKLVFIGQDGTPSPDFGPDSADGSVMDCVYLADGEVTRSIPPGSYEVLVGHGPEYDVEIIQLDIEEGQRLPLEVRLRRVVDTAGWVSAELHSHSTPSGDNTSSQRGRVENLVCEHIEFGPCTEHQRIESYEDFLEELDALDLMATCSGMELTGGPLPINHQNVFPLKWRPYVQAGGGPRTDRNPIAQIQRIAMWDGGSSKVVQINHPNLHQMARDKDKDGVSDGGFAPMFQFADVIEVHPPEKIFEVPKELSTEDFRKNVMLQWMKLLAEGSRIPGVVNTDAHYNHHGSGWLRNWVKSSTDCPAEISIDEMTKNLEAGRVIMSTGPYMNVDLTGGGLYSPAGIGDEVVVDDQPLALNVKIQCANWLDIDRVEVFVNGTPDPALSRRRNTHRDSFSAGAVRFDEAMPLELTEDSFIIVAAIGENAVLGQYMGESFGKFPPVVVSNPIYVRKLD
ncbi:MAG: CehA/McbA family metallohydrolase [Planctomycetota bacterium]